MKPFFILTSIVACFLAQAVLLAEPKSGNVTVAVGDVKITPPGGEAEKALKAGDQVAIGSTVKTGDDSRAVIVMTAKSAIRVAANSEVVIEAIDASETAPTVLLDLKSGSLGALLKPDANVEMDFKIKTPSGIAAARGTFFAVVVEEGKGFVQVKDGKVEIIPKEEDADAGADAN